MSVKYKPYKNWIWWNGASQDNNSLNFSTVENCDQFCVYLSWICSQENYSNKRERRRWDSRWRERTLFNLIRNGNDFETQTFIRMNDDTELYSKKGRRNGGREMVEGVRKTDEFEREKHTYKLRRLSKFWRRERKT